MAERTHRQRNPREDDAVAVDATESTGSSTDAQRRRDELDDLLDEIDEVLETNAEEFVKSYVQKGGQ